MKNPKIIQPDATKEGRLAQYVEEILKYDGGDTFTNRGYVHKPQSRACWQEVGAEFAYIKRCGDDRKNKSVHAITL